MVTTDFTSKAHQPISKAVENRIVSDHQNILHIDEQIRAQLTSKMSTLPQLQQNLKDMLWVATEGASPLDQLQARERVTQMRRLISDIEGGFELSWYLLRTSEMLQRYRSLLQSTRQTSFLLESKTVDQESQVHERNALIFDYLRIAREYLDLENFIPKPTGLSCPACHGSEFTQDANAYTCKSCYVQIEIPDDSPSFKDTDRVNMTSRYIYTTRGHFNDAMNRFTATQNTSIDESVLATLREQLAQHGLDGPRKKKVTKDHLYMFLSEQRLGEYYEDINLIYFLITREKPPDITHLRTELFEMHEDVEKAYAVVRNSERTNSLNVNFKLYKLLQLLGFKCNKDDFYFLKTPTKQSEHEEKWMEVIAYLQAKYPEAKTSTGMPRWRYLRTL